MRVLLLSRRQQPARRDEGAVAVFVAILMPVLMIMAAFALDIGNAYANGRQLSVSVDAATLAAAGKVGSAIPYGQACTSTVLTSIGATGIATAEANAVNTANNKAGTSEPVDSVTVRCASANSVEVSVSNSRVVKTALAGIIGIDEIRPNSSAVARYQRYPTAGGLRPWAVCETTVVAAQGAPNITFATWLDNKQFGGKCLADATGNWGGVDFDGGNNAAGDLAYWTQYGYPRPGDPVVTIPNPVLPADPGVSNSNALKTAFASLVNQVVYFPSVTGITGNGNNATFNAVGVVTAKVCGIRYGNQVYNTGSTCWDPALAATVVDNKGKLIDHIQFRWVNYTGSYTSGSNAPACDFTNRNCVGATLLWR